MRLISLLLALFCFLGDARAADLRIVHPPWLTPGATSSVEVRVSQDGAALFARAVRISLDQQLLASGRTSWQGLASLRLRIPSQLEQGWHLLVVEAAGERAEIPLLLRSRASLLLSADRERVLSDQLLRLQAQVTERVRRVPIPQQPFRFWLEREGELLGEARALGDDLGMATVSLVAPPEEGPLVAVAQAGDGQARRDLWVERSSALELRLVPAAGWMMADEPLRVDLEARHADGRPVARGSVELLAASIGRHGEALASSRYPSGSGWQDKCRSQSAGSPSLNHYARLRLRLDGEGRGAVMVPPPPYPAEIDGLLEEGEDEDRRPWDPEPEPSGSYLALRAELSGPDGERETAELALPLAGQPLLLGARWLHPPLAGVPSRLLVTAQQPDGTPADVVVALETSKGGRTELATGPAGVVGADLVFEDDVELELSATVPGGRASLAVEERVISRGRGWPDDGQAYALGLVARRSLLRPGEPLELEIRSPRTGLGVEVVLVAGGSLAERRQVSLAEQVTPVSFALPAGQRGLLTAGVRSARGWALGHALAVPAGPEEKSFARLSQQAADALWQAPGADVPLDGLSDAQLQDAMSFWLAALEQETIWPLTTHYRPQPGAVPAWVQRLSLAVEGALGMCPQGCAGRHLGLGGPGLALLISCLWFVQRRQRRRRAEVVLLLCAVAGLLAVWSLPWARGPRTVPPAQVAEGCLGRAQWNVEGWRRYPGLPSGALDRAMLPGGNDRFPTDFGPLVWISPDALHFNGLRVLDLDEYAIPQEARKGQLISPLYEVALAAAEDRKQLGEMWGGERQFRGQVTIVAPGEAAFGSVRAVMYTLGQAQFSEFSFVLPDEIIPVTPQGPGPTRHPLAYGLLAILLAVTLVVGRCRWPGFVAWLLLAGYGALHALLRLHPWPGEISAEASFPLENALVGLHWIVLAAVALALVCQCRASRKPPATPLAVMALATMLLAVPLSQDLRLYLRLPDRGTSQAARGAQRIPGFGREALRWSQLRRDRQRFFAPGELAAVQPGLVGAGSGATPVDTWERLGDHPFPLSVVPPPLRWAGSRRSGLSEMGMQGLALPALRMLQVRGSCQRDVAHRAYVDLLDARGLPAVGALDEALTAWARRLEEKREEEECLRDLRETQRRGLRDIFSEP